MATVLVVDDEADIRELVRINLVMAGHDVVLAADGVEGLDAVEIEQPDLVILDVMMPELDGWEVLSRMKASPEEHVSNTPVVMLTARSDDMDRIRGGIEGAIYYLTKPFSLADLRERVEEVLGGGPEPDQRRRAQQQALEDLARLEKGAPPAPADEARIRMTRLERVHEPAAQSRPEAPPVAETKMSTLSEKQRELLQMVSTTPTVSEAADRLEVSRSNVYASLRRIARKLEVRSVSELVQLARTGRLFPTS